MGTNFYEYINGFRVATFKQKVQNGDAQQFTLLALAYESGFNSKASFNRIFKKQTGLTPSQFKKQVENQK
jgi:AraC-like DNA-binding protein